MGTALECNKSASNFEMCDKPTESDRKIKENHFE